MPTIDDIIHPANRTEIGRQLLTVIITEIEVDPVINIGQNKTWLCKPGIISCESLGPAKELRCHWEVPMETDFHGFSQWS